MQLLRAAPVVEGIQAQQSAECELLQPSLAVILAEGEQGVDPASVRYVTNKVRYGQKIGAQVLVHKLEQPAIADKIAELNADDNTHGIIVQLPLPDRVQEGTLCRMIDPHKDVDGLHPQSHHLPATPVGIMNLLAGHKILVGEETVVTVNGARGKLVGQGVVELLRQKGAAVSEIDQHNADDLRLVVSASDILVTAVGKPGLVTPDIIDHPGLVVIDAGVGKVNEPDGPRTRGDLDPKAYDLTTEDLLLTPHYGGVGPMTVAALFDNVLAATRLHAAAQLDHL